MIFRLEFDLPRHGRIPIALQAAAQDALQSCMKILLHDVSAEVKMSLIRQ
jgi:hypothetical protein